MWSCKVIAPLACVAALIASAPAGAEVDEWGLSGGAGVWYAAQSVGDEEVTALAPVGRLELRYGLTDFWQVGASVGGGLALSDAHDPAFVGSAHLEAHYFIDAIEWVLFATVGAGVLVREQHPGVLAGEGAGAGADLSLILGVGLDYRPARAWSIGGRFRYQIVATDLPRTSPAFGAALVYTHYWR